MSDGALSQDEIDALLAGVDSGSAGSPTPAPAAASGAETDRKALQDFLSSNLDAESSNIAMITASSAAFKGLQVSFTNREAMLGQLPDTVTVVKADFNSGFPGEHLFILPEATAKAIAGLANKEENIELDDMAMSIINELISQFTGTEITALTNKTGNKSIAAITPEGTNVPKAVAALPGGEFASALYQLDLGDGKTHQIWEVLGPGVSSDIARALNGGAAHTAPIAAAMDNGMGMPNMGMGQAMPAIGGGMGMPNMGMGMGSPANVQSVQFPNLMPRASVQESGNIGLIMDVFMEMTVELGRTRKLIKDILGMGEGTIIELDKLAGEPVDILVNHKLIAKGEVVVIDENFGVRVTEIVSPMERMSDMG
ncbi:MAG: flagellar motor switch protein FliN [Treponema sp.]|jgi:flagellar motor switch protein FliN/FliY|nr:flagellar motor switch protein FliN [Treponema sp.]